MTEAPSPTAVERKLATVRSRSSSTGPQTKSLRPARPGHFRSRSYLSPINSNETPEVAGVESPEKPIETSRFHRLHLPGRHRHATSKDDSKATARNQGAGKHKYTQSESQQYHKKRDSASANGDSPTLTTSISRYPFPASLDQPTDILYPSSRGTAIPSLKRIASNRSARGNPIIDAVPANIAGVDLRSGQRRRASSDPRSPTFEGNSAHQLRPATHKTSTELLIDRADVLGQLKRQNVTASSLQHTSRQLDLATHELSSRLSTATRSAADLMRHLDDTQDTLFRTSESLVDTISSFANLSTQSTALFGNFTNESAHLSHDTRSGIAKDYHAICVTRGRRVDALEKRGQVMSHKAAELGQRLENCRTALKKWEEREENRRKAWRGVIIGTLWGTLLILVAALAGFISWKIMVEQHSGGVFEQHLDRWIGHNHTSDFDGTQLETLNVPEDVREILIDIDMRAKQDGSPLQRVSSFSSSTTASEHIDLKEESDSGPKHSGFRLLDEL